MNVKFSTKFVAASAAAVMALSLAGCSGGSMDDSSSSSAKASGDGSARVFAHFGLRPSPWR